MNPRQNPLRTTTAVSLITGVLIWMALSTGCARSNASELPFPTRALLCRPVHRQPQVHATRRTVQLTWTIPADANGIAILSTTVPPLRRPVTIRVGVNRHFLTRTEIRAGAYAWLVPLHPDTVSAHTPWIVLPKTVYQKDHWDFTLTTCRPFPQASVTRLPAQWNVPVPSTLYVTFPGFVLHTLDVRLQVPYRYRNRVRAVITGRVDGRAIRRRPLPVLQNRTESFRLVSQRTSSARWTTLRLETTCRAPCPTRVVWQIRGTGVAWRPVRHPARWYARPRTRPFPIVIVLIDALRADALSCDADLARRFPYTYRLCQDSLRFRHAYSNAGWTRTAVASLLTGLLPHQHGVLDNPHRLPDDVPYLPAILQTLGYTTAAFSTNGNISSPRRGFHRGFDDFFVYPESFRLATVHRPAPDVARDFAQWLYSTVLHRGRRLFAYLHFTDPHWPYHRDPNVPVSMSDLRRLPPDQQVQYATWMRATYNLDVRLSLRGLEQVVRTLWNIRMYRDSLIVVLADHGEAFYEHRCWQHAQCFFGEVLHIPLWIKWPYRRGPGRTVDAPVQIVDIVPTILALLGHPIPTHTMGIPLTRLDPQMYLRPLVAEQIPSGLHQVAVEWLRFRLYWNVNASHHLQMFHLYDEVRDPREMRNLYASDPMIVYTLLETYSRVRRFGARRPEEHPLSPEEIETLRALGYIR